VVAFGEGFAAVSELDSAKRVAFLEPMRAVLEIAALHVLERQPFTQIPFSDVDERVDRQVYDHVIVAQLFPLRASLYAVLYPTFSFRLILPDRDGRIAQDLTTMTCEEARTLVGGFE
jgi:hypothetical protein